MRLDVEDCVAEPVTLRVPVLLLLCVVEAVGVWLGERVPLRDCDCDRVPDAVAVFVMLGVAVSVAEPEVEADPLVLAELD